MNNRILRSAMVAASATGLLLISGVISAFAQVTTAPPVAGARMKIAEELGLTPAQKKQFMALRKSTMEQKKAIESAAVTPDVKKAKLKELEKSNRTSMASILTPAQIAKLKELRAERKEAAPGSTTPSTTTPGATTPKP